MEKVILPKLLGGLGVRNLQFLNRYMMIKWFWRYHSEDEALWIPIIKASYAEQGHWCTKTLLRFLWNQPMGKCKHFLGGVSIKHLSESGGFESTSASGMTNWQETTPQWSPSQTCTALLNFHMPLVSNAEGQLMEYYPLKKPQDWELKSSQSFWNFGVCKYRHIRGWTNFAWCQEWQFYFWSCLYMLFLGEWCAIGFGN